jgi:alpha-galactosidase
VKIVLIGAGSYVFAPTVLQDAIVKHRSSGELALVDLNLQAAEAMAGVGRRMAQDLGVACTVCATADRREVLPDADCVILSAAPEGRRRWQMDRDILVRAGMPDQVRECGGLGGLSYALRTISLALDICEDMAGLCPRARLLDVTNPMPRVVTAVHRFTDVECYGFCNASQEGAQGYEWLAGLVGRRTNEIDVVTAGLNHFAWLVSIRDRSTGEDLYPDVKRAIRTAEGHGSEYRRRWMNEFGAISAPGPGHTLEYLPPEPEARYRTRPPFHGNAQERQERMQVLSAIAAGDLDWRTSLAGGSWEHPVDVAVALDRGTELHVPMLNLPNRGYLADLPDGRIVEVPVIVEGGGVQGAEIGLLPGVVGELCKRVSDVHEWVARGAATGDRRALEQAITLDPAVSDKRAVLDVLEEMLQAHQDILPRFR